MGVYLYTLRAATTTVQGATGPVAVHHMKYATKLGGWREDDRRAAQAEAAADRAYAARKSNFFTIVGDNGPEDGDTVFEGIMATWVDCDSMKSTPVGFLKKQGRHWYIVDRTEWTFATKTSGIEDGLMVEVARRNVLVDGKITMEQRTSDNDRKCFVSKEEAVAKARALKAREAEAACAAVEANDRAYRARVAAKAEADAKAAEEAAQKALQAAQKALQDATAARLKAEAARQTINQ